MRKALPLHLKRTVTDLKVFLKNPSDSPDTETSTSGKLRVLLLVLLIDVVICSGFAWLISLIDKLGWYSFDNHAVAEMLRTFPLWGGLLIGVVFVPLLEEFVFRYGLRFRRGYFIFFFTALLLIISGYAFSVLPLVWALAAMVVLGVLLMLFILYSSNIIDGFLRQKWARMYRTVFYMVALLFGFVHITNFEYSNALIILAPILVAPQIVGGLLFGYMRVKHGFFWGYFLHAGHNAVFLGLSLLFVGEFEEKLNISNENYTLEVEEYTFEPSTSSNSTTVVYTAKDSVAFVNKKLDEVISDLLQKEKISVQFGENKRLNKTINLRYKSHAVDSAQNHQHILDELQKLYKFDISTASFEKEVWDMEIKDSSMLASHAAEEEGLLKIVVSDEAIEMENVALDDLLNTISKTYAVSLFNKTGSTGKYNFRFNRSNFDQLQEDLKAKYGLTVQPRKVLAEQALVSFRN